MMRAAHGKKKQIPAWARNSFTQALDDVHHLGQVARISVRGISVLRAVPQVHRVLLNADEQPSTDAHARLAIAQEEADLAQREVDLGFPLLYAWTTVALWAHLESAIRDIVTGWLKHRKTAWKVDAIQHLKIKLGEYESIQKELKHAFVADLLERETGAGLKRGVTRFETVLAPFGLSGDIPESISKTIYEFGQVRNIIAHRAARADRRFVQACPFLNLRMNAEVRVTEGMFQRYLIATLGYITLVFCRIGTVYGVDMTKHRNNSVELLAKQLVQIPSRKYKRQARKRRAPGVAPRTGAKLTVGNTQSVYKKGREDHSGGPMRS